MERLPDLGRGLVGKGIEGDRDLQLVVLAEIAHLQRAVDLDVLDVALRLQLGDAGLDQRVHHLRRPGLVEALGGHLHRALHVDAGVGEDEAEGRELAGIVGNDTRRDTGVVHQVGRMQRARAAEGQEREVARVEAALDQHRAERAHHVVVGDLHDGECRLLGGAAERAGDACDRFLRRFHVEGHFAAEEVLGVDAAEQQVGVGHRRALAACAVAGGAGVRARALGPHAQHAALVDPGDGAAARADGADVDHGDLDGDAELHLVVGGEVLLPAHDGRRVGRGAAHVEGDEVADPAQLGDMLARDHAAGGAGDGHLDRRPLRRLQGHLAAVGLDDDGLIGHPAPLEALAQVGDLAVHHRLDIGVRDGGGRALVFLPLRQHVVGDRDRNVRQLLLQDLLGPPFVIGRHVGEQEVDRHRLDGAFLPDLLRDGADPVLVERHVHRAVGHDPLVHLVAVAALDQRLRLDPGDVVVAAPVAPLDEGDVAKALGGHVGDLRALALQDCVGRHRRPQPDVADVRRRLEAPEPAQDAFVGVVGRRQDLPNIDRPGLRIVAHEIRERASDVDPDKIICQHNSPTQ